MGRPSKEPSASSTLVPVIVRHALARGIDVSAWVWRFGLPAGVTEMDEVTAAADLPEELLHAIAGATREPDVALRVAGEIGGRRHQLAQLAVRASANVRDALARLARWTSLLHEGLEAQLTEGGEARWILRTPRRPRGVGRHLHELALAYAILHLRAGADSVALTRVWFGHPRPSDVGALRAFFGTNDLTFGCEDSGFAFPEAALDRAMRFADARTVETIAPLIDEEVAARRKLASFADRVAAHVAASLPAGTDVGDVARAMHMSARTLQRRLEQEHTSFSDLLDRARLDVARRLLADPAVALTDVAFRLGFADLATFSRAFKRWTGMPPGQWRRS